MNDELYGVEIVDVNNLPSQKLFTKIFNVAKEQTGFVDYIIVSLRNGRYKLYMLYQTKNHAKIARNVLRYSSYQVHNKFYNITNIPDVCKIIRKDNQLMLTPIDY